LFVMAHVGQIKAVEDDVTKTKLAMVGAVVLDDMAKVAEATVFKTLLIMYRTFVSHKHN